MKPAIAPVGLDHLADSLEEEGHEARLLDLCFSESPWDEIKLTATRFPADIVGMTIRNTDDCYFGGQSFFLPEMKGILQKIRTSLRVPVVLGGAGYSIAPEAILDFCGADFGIVGRALDERELVDAVGEVLGSLAASRWTVALTTFTVTR